MNNTLVCAKVNPDLDGTACTLAYSYLLNKQGIKSEGLVFGEPQSEVGYFREKHGIGVPVYDEKMSVSWNNFVLVDASSMMGMPKVVKPERVIEIIDHRFGEPDKEFPNAKIQNDLIGAAATIVVERFLKVKVAPTIDLAKLLYGAIFHNTLNLISSNTSERDKKAILYLEMEFGFKRKIIEEMFKHATREIEKNPIDALEKDAKEFGEGNVLSFFQLIVWGDNIIFNKHEMAEYVEELRIKTKSQSDWSILNIILLESKQELLYVSNKNGRDVVSKKLNAKFDKEGWGQLPNILLRKQIIPFLLN